MRAVVVGAPLVVGGVFAEYTGRRTQLDGQVVIAS
jgi:hypothetical protein